MFALPLRNLSRRPVRSAIAISGILFGVVAYLLTGGFIEWIFWAMREGTIYSRLGHVQVTRPGFLKSGAGDPYAFLLPDKLQEAAGFDDIPEIRLVAPRLSFTGMISNGTANVSFIGEGVDPDKEKLVSRLLLISRGTGLSSNDSKGIILGEGLAANLGVQPGSKVVLLATPASGGVNAVEAHVLGTFYTLSKQFDDAALRVPIEMARDLLRTSGAHYWILLLDKTENTNRVVSNLRLKATRSRLQLEFHGWSELADFYRQTVDLYSRQMTVLKLIIGLMILLSISNTISMSVLERTGEIGTMMAMGIKKIKILRLFVLEAFLLGAGGGIAGLVLGMGIAWVVTAVGIPMPPAPGMSHGFTGEILLTPGLVLNAFLIAIAASTLAALYPAWRASRLQIVDALRANH